MTLCPTKDEKPERLPSADPRRCRQRRDACLQVFNHLEQPVFVSFQLADQLFTGCAGWALVCRKCMGAVARIFAQLTGDGLTKVTQRDARAPKTHSSLKDCTRAVVKQDSVISSAPDVAVQNWCQSPQEPSRLVLGQSEPSLYIFQFQHSSLSLALRCETGAYPRDVGSGTLSGFNLALMKSESYTSNAGSEL